MPSTEAATAASQYRAIGISLYVTLKSQRGRVRRVLQQMVTMETEAIIRIVLGFERHQLTIGLRRIGILRALSGFFTLQEVDVYTARHMGLQVALELTGVLLNVVMRLGCWRDTNEL